MTNQIDASGRNFIYKWEGCPLKAYKDPVGIWTIGPGLTSGSGVIKPYKGMVISQKEADELFEKAMARNYLAPFNRALGRTIPQGVVNGSASFLWNCGVGALKWKWFEKVKAGEYLAAAALVEVTAVKAGGKKLKGLVNRRKAEAALFRGYKKGQALVVEQVPEQWAARIKKLGYKSTEEFQAKTGLKVDGIIGQATRATIIRAEAGKTDTKTLVTTASAGTGVGGATQTPTSADIAQIDWASILPHAAFWGLVTVVATVSAIYIYRNRGQLFQWLPEGVKDFFQYRLGIVIGRHVSVSA